MKLKILTAVLGVVIVMLLGILIFVQPSKRPTTTPATPIVSADGHLSVMMPHPGDAVNSPIAIEGTVAGGEWFFEASFPIKVLDGDGSVIGQGTAQALSNWTSTGTVPFSASISFTAPRYVTGTILLESDNPSGLPENQKSLSIPVIFIR